MLTASQHQRLVLMAKMLSFRYMNKRLISSADTTAQANAKNSAENQRGRNKQVRTVGPLDSEVRR